MRHSISDTIHYQEKREERKLLSYEERINKLYHFSLIRKMKRQRSIRKQVMHWVLTWQNTWNLLVRESLSRNAWLYMQILQFLKRVMMFVKHVCVEEKWLDMSQTWLQMWGINAWSSVKNLNLCLWFWGLIRILWCKLYYILK